jgi:hypothetical protein
VHVRVNIEELVEFVQHLVLGVIVVNMDGGTNWPCLREIKGKKAGLDLAVAEFEVITLIVGC